MGSRCLMPWRPVMRSDATDAADGRRRRPRRARWDHRADAVTMTTPMANSAHAGGDVGGDEVGDVRAGVGAAGGFERAEGGADEGGDRTLRSAATGELVVVHAR